MPAAPNLIATQDAVILGRRSYDEWAEFWPGSEIQPFASFINAVPKYVATSTPLEREWTNSRVIDGGLVDFVRHLKGRPGGISASTAAFRSLGRCLLPTSSTSSGSSLRRRSSGAGNDCSTGCRPYGSRRSVALPHLVATFSSTIAWSDRRPFEHKGTHSARACSSAIGCFYVGSVHRIVSRRVPSTGWPWRCARLAADPDVFGWVAGALIATASFAVG